MTNTLTADLTRPIIGIENRTAQEVFDIMSDRIKHASLPSPPVSGEAMQALVTLNTMAEGYVGTIVDNAKAEIAWNKREEARKLLKSAISPLTNKPVGQFDTSDYIIVGLDGKPRRNEPVGVNEDQTAFLAESIASLPSLPVSGEAVAWLRDAHNGDGDECLVPCAKGDSGGFPVYASPGTNKPVGVTLSIEDVSRLHDLCLAITEFNEGDIFVTRPDFPELIARLSASIAGAKG